MNCADARNVILGADHNALRDRTDPVLREHLEGCTECAAAAAHVVADVTRLRAALIARGARPVARPRRSTAKRVAITLVPIALAAELAAFAFLGNRETPNSILDRHQVIDDTVTTLLPPSNTRIDTGEVVAVAPKPATRPRKVAKPTPKPDSVAERDTSLAAVPIAVSAAVGVMPRARQRYTVIATSDPKVTVVWLTKGDTL